MKEKKWEEKCKKPKKKGKMVENKFKVYQLFLYIITLHTSSISLY